MISRLSTTLTLDVFKSLIPLVTFEAYKYQQTQFSENEQIKLTEKAK